MQFQHNFRFIITTSRPVLLFSPILYSLDISCKLNVHYLIQIILPLFPILILMGLVHSLPPCFLKITFKCSVTRCASLAICYFDIISASLLGWSSEYSTTWCSVACSFLHPTYSPTSHSYRLLYCNATHFTYRQWQRLSITLDYYIAFVAVRNVLRWCLTFVAGRNVLWWCLKFVDVSISVFGAPGTLVVWYPVVYFYWPYGVSDFSKWVIYIKLFSFFQFARLSLK